MVTWGGVCGGGGGCDWGAQNTKRKGRIRKREEERREGEVEGGRGAAENSVPLSCECVSVFVCAYTGVVTSGREEGREGGRERERERRGEREIQSGSCCINTLCVCMYVSVCVCVRARVCVLRARTHTYTHR